jgi:hypothetical protein
VALAEDMGTGYVNNTPVRVLVAEATLVVCSNTTPRVLTEEVLDTAETATDTLLPNVVDVPVEVTYPKVSLSDPITPTLETVEVPDTASNVGLYPRDTTIAVADTSDSCTSYTTPLLVTEEVLVVLVIPSAIEAIIPVLDTEIVAVVELVPKDNPINRSVIVPVAELADKVSLSAPITPTLETEAVAETTVGNNTDVVILGVVTEPVLAFIGKAMD